MLNLLRAEIIKQSRLKLVIIIGLSPAIVAVVITAIMIILKILGVDFGDPPENLGPLTPDIGGGTFGLASQILLVAVGGLYLIGIALLGGMIGSSEYSWSTIKMLATREASRPRIILSKALFLATFTGFMAVVLLIGWLIYGLVLKVLFSGGSAGVAGLDIAAIGKGLRYLLVAFLLNLVWSIFTLFVAIRFKSVVVAIIFYFIVNTLDGIVSGLGEAALSGQLGTSFPNWLDPLISIAKIISPFLINFSFTQLTAQTSNPNLIQGISPVQPVLVLLAWGGLFLWLAVSVFNRRDITE
jgi:ABC-2 type transport system permease protein